MSRHDIVHGGTFYAPSVHVAPHFCRQWDDDGGCYGTREDHGYSWDDARAEVARWHRAQAERWASMSENEYYGIGDTDNEVRP